MFNKIQAILKKIINILNLNIMDIYLFKFLKLTLFNIKNYKL